MVISLVAKPVSNASLKMTNPSGGVAPCVKVTRKSACSEVRWKQALRSEGAANPIPRPAVRRKENSSFFINIVGGGRRKPSGLGFGRLTVQGGG
jgi:hypothetical protein